MPAALIYENDHKELSFVSRYCILYRLHNHFMFGAYDGLTKMHFTLSSDELDKFNEVLQKLVERATVSTNFAIEHSKLYLKITNVPKLRKQWISGQIFLLTLDC